MFFKRSEKGERRAKRSIGARGDVNDEELAQRRKQVAHEMEAFGLHAGKLEAVAAYGVDNSDPLRAVEVQERPRCGICSSCQRFATRKGSGPRVEDCGKCSFCADKPKFGGKATQKQSCLQFHCIHKLINGFTRAMRAEAAALLGDEWHSAVGAAAAADADSAAAADADSAAAADAD